MTRPTFFSYRQRDSGWAWILGQSPQENVAAKSGSGPAASVGIRLALESPMLWRASQPSPQPTVEGGAGAPGKVSRPTMWNLRMRFAIDGGMTILQLIGRVNGSDTMGVSGAYLGLSIGAVLANR